MGEAMSQASTAAVLYQVHGKRQINRALHVFSNLFDRVYAQVPRAVRQRVNIPYHRL